MLTVFLPAVALRNLLDNYYTVGLSFNRTQLSFLFVFLILLFTEAKGNAKCSNWSWVFLLNKL